MRGENWNDPSDLKLWAGEEPFGWLCICHPAMLTEGKLLQIVSKAMQTQNYLLRTLDFSTTGFVQACSCGSCYSLLAVIIIPVVNDVRNRLSYKDLDHTTQPVAPGSICKLPLLKRERERERVKMNDAGALALLLPSLLFLNAFFLFKSRAQPP